MLPFLRLAKVLLRPLPRQPTDALAGAEVRFRTWPNDLDLNRHMNNSRHLALMDLGRHDLTRRVGLLAACRRNRWFPVVASITVRYRRSLRPFAAFLRGDEVVATALVRAVFLSRAGSVPTATVLAAIGETRPSPPLPEQEG